MIYKINIKTLVFFLVFFFFMINISSLILFLLDALLHHFFPLTIPEFKGEEPLITISN